MNRYLILICTFALCCVDIFAGSVNIFNHWTGENAPTVYIRVESADYNNLKLQNQPIKSDKYYPLEEKVTAVTPAILSWDTLTAGKISYSVFPDNKPISESWRMNRNDNLSGEVAVSQNKINEPINLYIDNDDGVGLLCGIEGIPFDESQSSTIGYKSNLNNLITLFNMPINFISNVTGLPNTIELSVKINGVEYTKLVSPSYSSNRSWNELLEAYYNSVLDEDISLSLGIGNSNILNNGNNIVWNGTQHAQSVNIPRIDEPIKVELSTSYTIGVITYFWTLYIAESVWDSNTIRTGSANHGLYIKTTYPLPPNSPGFTHIRDNIVGAADQPLNWNLGENALERAYCLAVSDVLRQLLLGFRLCEINPQTNQFSSNDTNRYWPGINYYNKFIMDNSNAIGDSELTSLKTLKNPVVYHPVNSFSLRILSPTDINTGNFYSPKNVTENQIINASNSIKCQVVVPTFAGNTFYETLGNAEVNGNSIDSESQVFDTDNPVEITFSKLSDSQKLVVDFKTRKILNPQRWSFLGDIKWKTINGVTVMYLPGTLTFG